MNCIKAKIVSLKKRLLRRMHKKRATARRKTAAMKRHIKSLLRLRLRLRWQRQRTESACRDAVTGTAEERSDTTVPGYPDTGLLQGAESPITIPTLILSLSPPHTPHLTPTLLPPSPTSATSSDSSDEDNEPIGYSDLLSCSDIDFSDYEGDEEDGSSEDNLTETEEGEYPPPNDDSTSDSDFSSSYSSGWSSSEEDDSGDDGDHMDTGEGVGLSLKESSGIVADQTTCFGGAVTFESSTEEDLTDDADWERASENRDDEFHAVCPPISTSSHRPSQEHDLQCWEVILQSAVQQCSPEETGTLPRTSSVEELTSIFGDQEAHPKTLTPAPPLPSLRAPPPTTSLPSTEHVVAGADTDFVLRWWNQCLLQQNGNLQPTTTTSEPAAGHMGHQSTAHSNGCGFRTVPGSAFTATTIDPSIQPFAEFGRRYSLRPEVLQNFPAPQVMEADKPFGCSTAQPHYEQAAFTHQSTAHSNGSGFQTVPGSAFSATSTDPSIQLFVEFGRRYSLRPDILQSFQAPQATEAGRIDHQFSFPTQPPSETFNYCNSYPPTDLDQSSVTTAPPPLSATACAASEPALSGSQPPPLEPQTPPTSRGKRPAPLSFFQGEDESPLTPSPPPPPGPSTADRMWAEYVANRSTSPEYFLYPPFSPEQEEWIVQVDHPFKDYVLQTWQDGVHCSVQNSLRDLVN